MKNRFLTSRDYARLFERAKRILDHEFSKPSAEWDEGLIDELEETMLYCAERKKVLYSEEHCKQSLPSFKLRRAFVIVAAVLITLALSATVAQAAGFRVWSAIIHWDVNYLRVDYTGNSADTPYDHDITNSHLPIEELDSVSLSFDSFNALVSFLDSRLLLPQESDNLNFETASITDDGDLMVLQARFSHSGRDIRLYAVYATTADENTLSQSFADASDYHNVYTQDIEGVECVFGEKDETSYCSFACRSAVYRLLCNAEKETLITIVESMLKGVTQ